MCNAFQIEVRIGHPIDHVFLNKGQALSARILNPALGFESSCKNVEHGPRHTFSRGILGGYPGELAQDFSCETAELSLSGYSARGNVVRAADPRRYERARDGQHPRLGVTAKTDAEGLSLIVQDQVAGMKNDLAPCLRKCGSGGFRDPDHEVIARVLADIMLTAGDFNWI